MLNFISDTNIDVSKLLEFSGKTWKKEPSQKWKDLCSELQSYQPPKITLTIKNHDRKWEFVSAYQKSIRRGDKKLALWLIGGATTFHQKEWKYIWQRVCCTATEDTSYDTELMDFVIVCSQLFPHSVDKQILYSVWAFLTEKMCDAVKSRVHCTLSCIELWMGRDGITPSNLTEWESEFLTNIKEWGKKEHPIWSDTKSAWSLRSNWRGEGMLKYSGYPLQLDLVPTKEEIPHSEKLYGLPDYAYDVHTRTGKIGISKLCYLPKVRSFFETYPLNSKASATGDAIFYLEGGLLHNGVHDERLTALEHKFMAKKLGWTVSIWEDFQKIIRYYLFDTGEVNKIRLQVLENQGY